jgi:hypothetical protein
MPRAGSSWAESVLRVPNETRVRMVCSTLCSSISPSMSRTSCGTRPEVEASSPLPSVPAWPLGAEAASPPGAPAARRSPSRVLSILTSSCFGAASLPQCTMNGTSNIKKAPRARGPR